MQRQDHRIELGPDRVLERSARRELRQRQRPDPDHERRLDQASSRQSHGRHVRTIAAEGRTSPPLGRFPGEGLATAAM